MISLSGCVFLTSCVLFFCIILTSGWSWKVSGSTAQPRFIWTFPPRAEDCNNSLDNSGHEFNLGNHGFETFQPPMYYRTTFSNTRPKQTTRALLTKRSGKVPVSLTLDTTFECVAKIVSTRLRNKEFLNDADYRTSVSGKSRRTICGKRGSHCMKSQRSSVQSSEKRRLYFQERNGKVAQKAEVNGRKQLKNPLWKLSKLEGDLSPQKLTQYRQLLKEPEGIGLILHQGNLEKWRSREPLLATDEEAQKVLLELKSHPQLTALFNLYNFLIKRSLDGKSIWWSEEQFKALSKNCDLDDVNLTIRIGDLMKMDQPETDPLFSPEEQAKVGEEFVQLFKKFNQHKKSYHVKWSTRAGKKWLNENFPARGSGKTHYQRFIKSLMTPLEQSIEDRKRLGNDLKRDSDVPLSIKIAWLDLGFNISEMKELWYILEAYMTRNVRVAFGRAVKASKKENSVPIAYFDENLPQRIARLHQALSSESKKRRLMLQWIAKYVYSKQEIDEALLNIGKYAGNSRTDRFRFNILLFIHHIFYGFKNCFQSLAHWSEAFFRQSKKFLNPWKNVAGKTNVHGDKP